MLTLFVFRILWSSTLLGSVDRYVAMVMTIRRRWLTWEILLMRFVI